MKNRLCKGIVMVEFLTGLALLVIVLLGTCSIFNYSHQLAEDSRQRILALGAASSVLETVKNTALASVPSINTAGMVPANLPSATITIATNPQNVSAANIATVTVTVNWTGPKGRARSLDVSTMRSRF